MSVYFVWITKRTFKIVKGGLKMAFQDNYILRVDCKCEDGTHVCYENEEGVTDYIIPNECTEIVYCKNIIFFT